jgi:hypothetical protein
MGKLTPTILMNAATDPEAASLLGTAVNRDDKWELIGGEGDWGTNATTETGTGLGAWTTSLPGDTGKVAWVIVVQTPLGQFIDCGFGDEDCFRTKYEAAMWFYDQNK